MGKLGLCSLAYCITIRNTFTKEIEHTGSWSAGTGLMQSHKSTSGLTGNQPTMLSLAGKHTAVPVSGKTQHHGFNPHLGSTFGCDFPSCCDQITCIKLQHSSAWDSPTECASSYIYCIPIWDQNCQRAHMHIHPILKESQQDVWQY